MIINVHIKHDDENDRWIARWNATGKKIVFSLESGSLDALFERVCMAVMDVENMPFSLVFKMAYKREVIWKN